MFCLFLLYVCVYIHTKEIQSNNGFSNAYIYKDILNMPLSYFVPLLVIPNWGICIDGSSVNKAYQLQFKLEKISSLQVFTICDSKKFM